MSSKCKIDGCQRSKDLSSEGLCTICVRASSQYSSAGSSSRNISGGNIDSIDLSSIEDIAEKVKSGDPIDQNELLKSMFSLVYKVAKSINSLEDNSSQILSSHDELKN